MTVPPVVELERLILELLKARTEGIGEFELLRALRDAGYPHFDASSGRLALFRAHFLLFHILYRLDERLQRSGRGELEIGALCIRIRAPGTREPEALSELDRLREYYLDLSNLADTTEDDVRDLIDSFWERMEKGLCDPVRREQALSVLGLADPVDDLAIKKRYRELSLQHHPDRGGDGARLREINAAMAVLSRNR